MAAVVGDSPGKESFSDTNTLVYAHDLSAGRKRSLARRLVEEAWLSIR